MNIISLFKELLLRNAFGKEYAEKRRRKRFRKLLFHAWDKSNFYRDLYSSHGLKRKDLRTVNLTDLPIVTKDMLIDNYDDVLTKKALKHDKMEKWLKSHKTMSHCYLNKYILVHTSGTTGKHVIFAYDKDQWQFATSLNTLESLPIGDLLLGLKETLAGIIAIDGHYTGVTLFQRSHFFKYKKQISITLTKPEIIKQLNKCNPSFVVCYASVLSELYTATKDGELKISPKYIFSSGEYLSDELRLKIQSIWPNCTLYDIYTTTETLMLSYRKDIKDDFQVFNNTNIMELLDDDHKQVAPGKVGLITVTNLENFITPTIRYQFSDYATSVRGLAEGEWGLSSLSSLEGRVMQELPIIDKSGKILKINPHILNEFFVPKMNKIQFISDEINKIQLLYTASEEIDNDIKEEFQNILTKYNALESVDFTVKKVDQINAESNGKTVLVKINFKLTT